MMSDEHLITLQPGTVVAGRYEVVKCLGAGSMGLVYACRHRELSGHLVAIKVLFPEVAQDSVAAARFRNEIVASYGVSHPNVVRAYEYFRDGDLVAYTMEYIGGGDLADKLGRNEARLPIDMIMRYLAQIASGVQAIHDAGIVHRDLKPENILLTENGDVKITDFGIARTGHGPKLTEHGGVVGTIDYVSPEYLEKGQVDYRSDIYAIGVLGYEMITGESPFRGDSVIATMTMRLRTDPKTPSSLRADCPKELDRIILQAMHRNPELRYQRAIEINYDLLPLIQEYDKTGTITGAMTNQPRATIGNPHNFPSIDQGYSSRRVEPAKAPVTKSTFERVQRNQGFFEPTVTDTNATVTISSLQGYGQGAGQGYDQIGGRSVDNNLEEDTLHEPFKMESVLSQMPEDPNSRNTSIMQIPDSAPLVREGIDSRRIRALTQGVAEYEKPLWIDLVTLVVAVAIGLGVGLALISIFWPSLFSPKNVIERDIRVLG